MSTQIIEEWLTIPEISEFFQVSEKQARRVAKKLVLKNSPDAKQEKTEGHFGTPDGQVFESYVLLVKSKKCYQLWDEKPNLLDLVKKFEEKRGKQIKVSTQSEEEPEKVSTQEQPKVSTQEDIKTIPVREYNFLYERIEKLDQQAEYLKMKLDKREEKFDVLVDKFDLIADKFLEGIKFTGKLSQPKRDEEEKEGERPEEALIVDQPKEGTTEEPEKKEEEQPQKPINDPTQEEPNEEPKEKESETIKNANDN